MRLMHLCRSAAFELSYSAPVRNIFRLLFRLIVFRSRRNARERIDIYLHLIIFFFLNLSFIIIVDINTALQNQSVLRFSFSIERNNQTALILLPTRSFVFEYYLSLSSASLLFSLRIVYTFFSPPFFPFSPFLFLFLSRVSFSFFSSCVQGLDLSDCKPATPSIRLIARCQVIQLPGSTDIGISLQLYSYIDSI